MKKRFLIHFVINGLLYAGIMSLVYYLQDEPQSPEVFFYHFFFFGLGMTLFTFWFEKRRRIRSNSNSTS